jgi:hypothetical protein
MDRKTNYFGELIPETDNLQAQQFAMTALAYACQGFIGTGTAVDGFTCVPTTPASLNVQVTPGCIYQVEPLEATTWSSLPANSSEQILKQGILHNVDTIAITPPGTVGFSQVFLIEAQYADLDTTPVLLPYYNASNPSQPFQGPNNSGQSQNTVRLGIASIQVKVGIAAATGTQMAPTPDAGWTGLFLITVANGQTTITAGNITAYLPTSFIPFGAKLPALPSSIQNNLWIAFSDIGTADALVITPSSPAPAGYTIGQAWLVRKGASANATTTPTLNVTSPAGALLGAKAIVDRSGNTIQPGDLPANAELWLVYDGANFRNMGVVSADFGKLGTLRNVKQFTTSTRVAMSGSAGNSYTVQAWAPGSYVKQSATSTLLVWMTAPTFVSGSFGPGQVTLNVGGTNFPFVPANNNSSTAIGEAALVQQLSGISAGSLALTLSFSRNDATAWTASFAFNSSDNALYPASTTATLIIAEVGV